MMKKIAGIDYSLTSPAICVWKQENDRLNKKDEELRLMSQDLRKKEKE